jgi:hypothetical protein
MNDNRYTINPLTGRSIRIGSPTYCRLVIEAYDFINGHLIRRNTAPPLPTRPSYLNTETNRLITFGTRRYYQLLRAGWEIEEDYYLVPPERSVEYQAILAQIENEATPLTYEQLIDRHKDRLAELNITLCKDCLIPIKIEDGGHCEQCQLTNN